MFTIIRKVAAHPRKLEVGSFLVKDGSIFPLPLSLAKKCYVTNTDIQSSDQSTVEHTKKAFVPRIVDFSQEISTKDFPQEVLLKLEEKGIRKPELQEGAVLKKHYNSYKDVYVRVIKSSNNQNNARRIVGNLSRDFGIRNSVAELSQGFLWFSNLNFDYSEFSGEKGNFFLELCNKIRTSRKPIISVIGPDSGASGSSLPLYSSASIATNTSSFSSFDVEKITPEHCSLDPSLIYKLAQIDDGLGQYLALTGTTITGTDIWHAGLATVYMPNDNIPNLEESLRCMDMFSLKDVWQSLMYVMEDPGELSIQSRMKIIKECFDHEDLDNIWMALRRNSSNVFVQKCMEKMNKVERKSPHYLDITMKLLKEAGHNDAANTFSYGESIIEKISSSTREEFEIKEIFKQVAMETNLKYADPRHTKSLNQHDLKIWNKINKRNGQLKTYIDGYTMKHSPLGGLKGPILKKEVIKFINNRRDKFPNGLKGNIDENVLYNHFKIRLQMPKNQERLKSIIQSIVESNNEDDYGIYDA